MPRPGGCIRAAAPTRRCCGGRSGWTHEGSPARRHPGDWGPLAHRAAVGGPGPPGLRCGRPPGDATRGTSRSRWIGPVPCSGLPAARRDGGGLRGRGPRLPRRASRPVPARGLPRSDRVPRRRPARGPRRRAPGRQPAPGDRTDRRQALDFAASRPRRDPDARDRRGGEPRGRARRVPPVRGCAGQAAPGLGRPRHRSGHGRGSRVPRVPRAADAARRVLRPGVRAARPVRPASSGRGRPGGGRGAAHGRRLEDERGRGCRHAPSPPEPRGGGPGRARRACRGGRLRRRRSAGERRRRAADRGGERDSRLERPAADDDPRHRLGGRVPRRGSHRGPARPSGRPGAMSRTKRRGAGIIAAAAQTACLLEVVAPKPGNVSRGHDLPGLTYRDFVLSAYAIGPAFSRFGGDRVGRLILEAVRATRRHVRTNTNLGIILLLAPLARAARRSGGTIRERLRRVLLDLDVRDARDAYRAIRIAGPGGLGRVGRQDVHTTPTVSLLETMRLAQDRDAVAREYATGFAATFDTGLPTLHRLRDRHVPLPLAIAQTYLTLLAAGPDTLVARRHGAAAAGRVARLARQALRAGGFLTERGRSLSERLDRRLRAKRPPLNPGATADLTVGAIFLWLLDDGVRTTRARLRGSSRGPRTRTRPAWRAGRPRGAGPPPFRPPRRRTRPDPRRTVRR